MSLPSKKHSVIVGAKFAQDLMFRPGDGFYLGTQWRVDGKIVSEMRR